MIDKKNEMLTFIYYISELKRVEKQYKNVSCIVSDFQDMVKEQFHKCVKLDRYLTISIIEITNNMIRIDRILSVYYESMQHKDNNYVNIPLIALEDAYENSKKIINKWRYQNVKRNRKMS